MLPVVNLNYETVLHEVKRREYKAVIFFLYNNYTDFPDSYLSDKFRELDNLSEGKVAFISNYAELDKAGIENIEDIGAQHSLSIYRDLEEIQNKTSFRTRYNYSINQENESKKAYKTMQKIAKSFECGMENRLPCFVIFNPQNPQLFIEKPLENQDSVFLEATNIITEMRAVNYDLEDYAKKRNDYYHCLSSVNSLEETVRAITYQAISVDEIEKVIREDHCEECIDLDKIYHFSQNGFISVKEFYKNLDRIQTKEVKDGKWSSLIDKYLMLFESGDEMLFPEIKGCVEASSCEYLHIAQSCEKASYSCINSSLKAICLGKVVEDEIKLGYFNRFRNAFGVEFPTFFDRVQPNLQPLQVTFHVIDANGKKRNIEIYFNKAEGPKTSRLKYPNVSDIRKIAFYPNCQIEDASQNQLYRNTLNEIDAIRNMIIPISSQEDIYDYLKTIAAIRNKAIHHAKEITRNDSQRITDAFEGLVRNGFFQLNHCLKDINRCLYINN